MPSPSSDALQPFLMNDPRLLAPARQSLQHGCWRILLCALLAAYAWMLPSPVWHDTRTGAAILAGLALLYLMLALHEHRHPQGLFTGRLARLLDLSLLVLAVASDPLPETPTLGISLLLAGLALPQLLPARYRVWLAAMLLGATAALAFRQQLGMIQADWRQAVPMLVVVTTLLLWFAGQRQSLLALQLGQLNTLDDDPVTGIGTRYSLYAAARFLWPLAHRQLIPFTLLYLEVTPTAARCNAAQANQLARLLADCSLQHLRGCDVLTRYDQLGFVFCLPDCQHKEAEAIAHRLHTAFHTASAQAGLPATLQIGATWLPEAPRALDDLLHNVIQAVHRARQYPLTAGNGVAYADPEQGRHALHWK